MEVEKGDRPGHDGRQRETGMCRQVKHTILPNINRQNNALFLRFQHCDTDSKTSAIIIFCEYSINQS